MFHLSASGSCVLLFSLACFAQTDSQPERVLTLSLAKAIEMATSDRGDARVQLAHEAENVTRSRYIGARAALLPSVDVSVAEQNQTVNPRALGLRFDSPLFSVPNEVGPFNTFDARVRLTQNIVNLSAIRQWQGSRTDVRVAKYETEAVRKNAAGMMARLYAAALQAEARVGTYKASISDAEALRDLSSHRSAVGEGTELDVTRAELSVARARQRLLAATTEQNRNRLELVKVLNLDWATTLHLSDQLDGAGTEPPGVRESLSLALETRPDLKMQATRIESAKALQNAARLERAPSLVAYGDYGVLQGVQTHTVGVALRVPLFDDRIKSDQIRAFSLARQADIRQEELKRDVELEIRKAMASLEATKQEVAVADQAITLATEELGRARRRYQAGLANNLEVIEAQTQLETARGDRVAALFDRANARIDWALATGTIMSIAF